MKKVVIFLVTFFISLTCVFADSDKNLVNIYLFHSETCPHCREEIMTLDDLVSEYDNVKVYKYEIGNDENLKLLEEISEIYDTPVSGVPFTVIGDKYFKGFSYENYYARFRATIDYYSEHGYTDHVGEHIGGIPLPTYEVDDDGDIDTYIDEKTNYKIKVFGKEISLKNLTLPVISILIGLVDGFNPCAMWVLLFLISMLIGMNDRKKMFILGFTFLFTSAFVYLLFMLAWLNAATLLLAVKWVRMTIGLVALVGGIINLSSYIRHRKDNGCDVIDEKKRSKIFDKIKKFTHEKNLWLAAIGAIALAVSVNIVELACSAGLPVMFIQILSMNNPNLLERIVYIALYMIAFLLDDLIVFIIAMRTMEVTGFSTKYGKISKLIGGILLLLIGILMILKPQWLMFNF